MRFSSRPPDLESAAPGKKAEENGLCWPLEGRARLDGGGLLLLGYSAIIHERSHWRGVGA